MGNQRLRGLLAVVVGSALLSLPGCGRDFTLPDVGKDTTPPGFSGVLLSPDHATVGTEVVLDFDASEVLPPEVSSDGGAVPNPQVGVNGLPFVCTLDGLHHHCTLQVERGMQEGSFEVSITAVDGAGNQNVPLASPPVLEMDFTPPLLTVTVTPPQIEPGQVLAVVVRADEGLSALPAITSDFFAPMTCEDDTGVGRLFTCTTLLELALQADGEPHIVEARSGDLAGNQAQGQTTVILASPSPRLDPASVVVAPKVVTDGQSVGIVFRSVGSKLDRCGLLVGTRVATCLETHIDTGAEPAYTECTCAFDVVPQVLEGIQTVILSGTNRRGSAQLQAHFNVDRTAPRLDASKLHFLRRATGRDDAMWAEPGAAADDLGLPYSDPAPSVSWLHVYDGPGADALRLKRFRPSLDGSLANAATPVSLGDTEAVSIWVEPEDIAGNLGPRVIAGRVEATLTFDGRAPYDPSVSPLSIHPFSTDLDPLGQRPGFGAAMGEGDTSASALVATQDGASLTTRAEPPSYPPPWGNLSPQFRARTFSRIGGSHVNGFRHPVTGAFELRGGRDNLCGSGGSNWASGGQRFFGQGFQASTRFDAGWYSPVGDFDPIRGLEVWTNASGNLVECGGRTCVRVTPVSRPTTASYAGAAFHLGLGKLVRFGGFEAPNGVSTFYNQTWAYDPDAPGGATWAEIVPQSRPGGRAGYSMASDGGSLDAMGNAVGPRLYVYGGWVGQWPAEQRYSDLWAFDGLNWSLLSSSGLAGARSNSVMVRDPVGNRLLVSGGYRWVGTTAQGYPDMRIDSDVQAFDLSSNTWSTLQPTATGCGSQSTLGPCSYAPTGFWDPLDGRLLVYAEGEIWAFHEDLAGTPGAWENLTPITDPVPRVRGALIAPPGSGRLAYAGGLTETGLVSSGISIWDGRWHTLASDPLRSDLPPVVTVRLPNRPATLLFVDQTTWTVAGRPGEDLRVEPATLVLPANGIRGAAFDTARQEAILLDGSIPPRTYRFDGTKLTQLVVTSPPPFRDRYDLVYDAARGETLFFGGLTFNGTATDELWAFDGEAWALRSPAPSAFPPSWSCGGTGGWPPPPPLPSAIPVPRTDAALVYDARSGRVLLFGGTDDAGVTLGDAWSYDGLGWQMLLMPECSWSGGVELPSQCSGGYTDLEKVAGLRSGVSATFVESEGAVAFIGGARAGVPIVDDGFMLAGLPRPDARRTPAHLFGLRLEAGATLSSLVVHHEGVGLSPQAQNTPEPGLRIHVWAETGDPLTSQPPGWIEISPSGTQATNETLNLDVGARLADPQTVPVGLGVRDLIVGEQVWFLVTPREGSRRILGAAADGHAELSTDRFWIEATYAF